MTFPLTVHAADLRAPIYKAPVVEDWTGAYIGVELGGKYADTTWTATSLRDAPGVSPASGVQNAIDITSPRTYNPSSFRAGGYLGYNWQINQSWVVGVEGDIASARKSQTAAGFPGCTGIIIGAGLASGCTSNPPGVAPGFVGGLGVDSATIEMRWDASIRGRVGFLVAPNLLLYGTGGVAWQNMRSIGACSNFFISPYCNTSAATIALAPPGQVIQNSTTRMGATVGAGLEAKIYGNWLLRGEYRYADFRPWNEVFAFMPDPLSNNTYRYQLTVHTHIVTFGLAYKFAWARTVVAKY
jgi:outer membrane immunogenic protein